MIKARLFHALAAMFMVGYLISPMRAMAQDSCVPAKAGNPAVYSSCNNGASPVGTAAYIDASVFFNGDICSTINGILKSTTTPASTYPAGGAVIDTRGVLSPGTCAISPFRGTSISTTVSVPSTILLPAVTIPIQQTWILPSNTRIIGGGTSEAVFSTLQVASGFTASDSNNAIIEMCASGATCTGVSVEHLTVNGQDPTNTNNPSVNGIYNAGAQGQSYVNDVNLQNVLRAGVVVSSNAGGSGPYTNINYGAQFVTSCTGSAGNGGTCPACAVIQASTRGLYGATCIGAPIVSGNVTGVDSEGDAAIFIQASGNTVQDIHVEGFWDGVQVGNSGSNVRSVIVSNVTGAVNGNGGSGSAGPVTNTVHICGTNDVAYNSTSSPFGICFATPQVASPQLVSDVTVSQASIHNSTSGMGTSVIQDGVTGTSITPVGTTNPSWVVGMYVLGEPVPLVTTTGSNQYTRFSTSPSPSSGTTHSTVMPTWGIGTAVTSGTCTTPGALYSNTSGSGTLHTVYICAAGTWQPII